MLFYQRIHIIYKYNILTYFRLYIYISFILHYKETLKINLKAISLRFLEF